MFKLKRYSALGVKEVWFWEDGVISIHCLDGNEYKEIQQSHFLPNLNTKQLAQCVVIESIFQALKAFRNPGITY